ncbi:MAG: hypothetical protein Kow0029_25490 [Candidatus Rifleibacteriota bacterium]
MAKRESSLGNIALFLLCIMFCFSTPLKAASEIVSIPIEEASAITTLPDGSFIVVDDEKGIYHLDSSYRAKLLVDAKSGEFLDDLEGVAISSDQKKLYFLSERRGQISCSDLKIEGNEVSLSAPMLLGTLPEITRKRNKGWEGICIINLNGIDHLLAVHQEEPKAIAILELPALKLFTMCELPLGLDEQLKNLSDVAVDRKTGHIYLLSGKSSRFIEVAAKITTRIEELDIVSSTKLKGDLNGKPEGITFNGRDQVVIVTDADEDEGDLITISE